MVCAMIVCINSNAQVSLTGDISLRDAMEATISVHPYLSSFPLREEALLGERETATLRPEFRVGAQLEDTLGTGNLRDFTGTEATLTLSSVIEMGDKREARLGIANSRLNLLNAEQRVFELDLLTEVVRRFIDVATAQQQILLQTQATEIAMQTYSLLEPLVTSGRTPQLELDRASAALLRARIAEQSAATFLESAKIRLANMWASNTPQFNTVNSTFLAMNETESIDFLLSNLESNPDIEIYASESRLLEAELRQAQAQIQSNIGWTAGIRHLKELDDTGLTFGITIPLFSKARSTGSTRTARANLQEIESRRLSALNSISGEVRSLHLQLQQAISEVNLLRQEVIPTLEDVLQQTSEAYAAGNYSYVELISAQQEFLEAQFSLISSASNAHKLRAEIERLSGIPLTGQ